MEEILVAHSHVPQQGASRPRPPKGHAQSHPGVQPISPFGKKNKFQPLPDPMGEPPYHYVLDAAIPDVEATAKRDGKLVFHVCGDTGGIKHPEYQMGVAAAMKADLDAKTNPPSFFYHLGDVIYYNGQISDYFDQFYEPYDHYTAPIISIPGNHDGEPADPSQTSLDGWVRYFMSGTPQINPESQDAPRYTMSQPNVYFTLVAPFVTIIGMYSNVPEGGSVDSIQQQWLTNEFSTAPTDKALIVALHHPIYSFDDHHSGSARMADVVQHAINDSRRVPNMVLTAHVHNYQRIEKEIIARHPTPFMVIGNGGYYHMHNLSVNVGHRDSGDTGAKLIAADAKHHGYVTLTVDADKISGTLTTTDPTDENPTRDVDTFEYPAKAIHLPKEEVASL